MSRFRYVCVFFGLCAAALCAGQTAPPAEKNLALAARATASETYQDLTPEKAIDGQTQTRWSGIPGHNADVWFQLEWDAPVRIAEVVLRQYDRFVMELDVQVWDERAGDWRTLQHFGEPGKRLPLVVVCRTAPQETRRLRIGNTTNGPSFTEVEAYAAHFAQGLATRLASDVDGHFVGLVTDALGASPVPDAAVTLTGRARGGAAAGGSGAAEQEWTATARSDENGLFIVPMPVGLSGALNVRTIAEEQTAHDTFDCTHFQYGLTPRGLDAEVTPLAGPWRFAPDPPDGFWRPEFDDAGWATIAVPAHWEMEGFHPAGGVGGYRTRFAAPAGGGRLKLVFDGVYSGAAVWVNGVRVAYHEGGFTPFECDITDTVHAGENVLALRVTEHTVTSDELDHMSFYADFPLGGIMRKVYLLRVPAVHVGALAVHTRFDADFKNGTIEGSVALVNESEQTFATGVLRFGLMDPAGKPVALRVELLAMQVGPWSRAEHEFSIPVDAPAPWNAEHPNLYVLTLELQQGDAMVQRLSQRIGFRQTDVRGPQLLINGVPVKFRGTCHHDSDPRMGRAVTAELTRRDLSMMKEANLNAVRTSHYPPIPELLDIADELGLYVEDEAPFCWVGVSDDLRLTPHILQLTAELLARDRNHPSVFMWSLCNESQFGRGFERSCAWVHTADPSRPAAAATSAWLDIATLHNPITVGRIDEQAQLDRPLLFDESLAPFQGIWGDIGEMWLDPGIRDYYGVPLRAVYERLMQSKTTQGSMIWCWADDIFCVPGRGYEYGRGATPYHFVQEQYGLPERGLVGDAPWGVVDGWRRPKPEFWIVKKLHSPVRIQDGPLAVPDGGGEIRLPVENQYDFTDLSELSVAWDIGDEHGTVVASIPPKSTGELRITPRQLPKAGNTLTLTFTNAAGVLVDQYKLPFGEEAVNPPFLSKADAPPLRIEEESTLAGRATRVIGGHFELAFDRGSGGLRHGVAFGQALLLELPSLHVLPARACMSPLPDRLTWKLRSLDIKSGGDGVRVLMSGAYEQFGGGYEILVTPAGEITVSSSFEYSGPDLWAREVGLRLSVPRQCDLLQWDRQAEWSVYPDDHIGRPRGHARAVAAHPPPSEGGVGGGSTVPPAAVPPTWPWSLDNSPLGSNDFRSTKRNIHWAALGYPAGAGLLVLSDGRQHARALVESERISLHINDWYGGTNAGLWEWESNYGKGRLIKKGEKIECTVHLRVVRAE